MSVGELVGEGHAQMLTNSTLSHVRSHHSVLSHGHSAEGFVARLGVHLLEMFAHRAILLCLVLPATKKSSEGERERARARACVCVTERNSARARESAREREEEEEEEVLLTAYNK